MMMARKTPVAVASATLQCSEQQKWQQQAQCSSEAEERLILVQRGY